jgi:hypothetical protein
VTALERERDVAGATVVSAVVQDVNKKLSAVDSQLLKRALDYVQ